MANVQANGIQIEYDTFGKRTDRPLLLVMGLGAQMIHWRAEFCEQLASAGHFVVRYDNRDVGLSTQFDAAGLPDLAAIMTQMAAGEPISAPYTLNDMADDGIGLLDALDLPTAHICGASMGGMIVQHDGDTAAAADQERHFDHVEHRQSRTAACEAGGDGGVDESRRNESRGGCWNVP